MSALAEARSRAPRDVGTGASGVRGEGGAAPVKIGDTVDVIVSVAELTPEKFRARLACTCSVGDDVVLDGEAWVKVPSKEQGGRPLPRV